ncbi:hypothetical protein TrLO_g9363 [Triparma laevis f. longispina]|uniref:Uncharacterized protein n=1 Tax=Triparma laevis f. longispina TaxID=1714387 RepID=A0A9W7FSW8_9STRA|nr:hypothetical protein TrLO_g9363 [Triparma laevis f. longispina]
MHNTTFDYTISFEKDVEFYPDAIELAKIVFSVLCVMFTMAISLKYHVGEGTKKYRKNFVLFALITLITVQYYQLWFALLTVPVDFPATARRWDCLKSSKGGKVAWGNSQTHSTNPCFCHVNATCSLSNGQVFNVTVQDKAGYNASETSDVCILDPDATCSFKNNDIERLLESAPQRDCNAARGAMCSPGQPCTPCEWSRKEEFGDRWSRCSMCNSNNDGKCDFVPGVGPYCYKSASSREVVPCTKCCTEKVIEYDTDGFCF